MFLSVFDDWYNVPFVKNSQKTVKTAKITIVTCLPKLYQQCTNRQNSQTAKNYHWCTNRHMSSQSPPNTHSRANSATARDLHHMCLGTGQGALKMQDRLDVRYNEQTRKALLCHVCRHCCVHGQWRPDMQKPNTHGAASVPIKLRLTISVRTWLVSRNLTSNVMLCAILWTDVYTQTVADCFITTYNRINFATSTSVIN